MKIVLSGVETNNKGAELMLYAILQEIERVHPTAKVYIPGSRVKQGLEYIKTTLDFRFLPFERIIEASHINSILRRLGLPELSCLNFVKADYFFDGSGFVFSDQCGLWGTTPKWWERILKYHYKNKAKIIFLPQAFGPIELEKTQEAIEVLSKYATIIMPREQVSFNYLKESGLVDMTKVKMFADYTSLVKGSFPDEYRHLYDGICIIPNIRMVDRGAITMENYKTIIKSIVLKGRDSGHKVYLLIHDECDERLAYTLRKMLNDEIEVVRGLNALEVKGMIASAYLVVSSRFHGVASSLSSCVPCLATSWSHKYQELFKDYGFEDNVLPLDNQESILMKIESLLNKENNNAVRQKLLAKIPQIENETKNMWKTIWLQ